MSKTSFDSAPTPIDAGFDPERLARLHARLQGLVDEGRLPGAVTLIVRRGRLAAFAALGWQDAAVKTPMRTDTIFRIFSMTKPIVSVAVMRWVEQGRLLLGDPLARFLPEFADVRVHRMVDGVTRLAPPARPITIQDLLRHTAGLTYEFLPPSPVRALYAEAGIGARERTNAEHAAALARLPLMHEPGSVWDYSRATDVLGRLLEVLANRSLGEHLREVVFEPLGMVDTGFVVPAEQADRLAEPLVHDPDTGDRIALMDPRQPAALESGGGGLVSTARDYAVFLDTLLRGGTRGGVKLLGRKTIEHMTSDHLGGLPSDPEVLPPGHGFGLGFAVRLVTGMSVQPGSVGTYGWGGAAGTVFFVDPLEEMFALMMIQAPGQREEFQQRFRAMVYAALET